MKEPENAPVTGEMAAAHHSRWAIRALAQASVGLLLSSSSVLASHYLPVEMSEARVLGTDGRPLTPEEEVLYRDLAETDVHPEAITLEQPQPTPTDNQLLERNPVTGPEILDPRAELAVARMQLSPQGYSESLSSIDSSLLGYSQQFAEFNPALVGIPQGPSETFVLHFTAFFRNADGAADAPVGEMNLPAFIEGMANRGGSHCCGVNWVIDRYGKRWQTAPLNAKLRHNPPFDSIVTGVEIEARTEGDMTTRQYEQAAYLSILVLQLQGRLGNFPLEQILQGHGEMRDRVLAENPHLPVGIRDDFNAPLSERVREKILSFLTKHPEVIGQTRPLS